jgi:hypothetical protein
MCNDFGDFSEMIIAGSGVNGNRPGDKVPGRFECGNKAVFQAGKDDRTCGKKSCRRGMIGRDNPGELREVNIF